MRREVEEALYFVAQKGWTLSSEDFFTALVTFLGEELGFEYAIVDELLDDGVTARTVGLYAKGGIQPNLEYGLPGTPCENVMGKELCYYPRDVQALFPRDVMLQELGAHSYIGVPLWASDGTPLGLIAVMGCEDFDGDRETAEAVLQVVAVRCAHELERKRADAFLRRHRSFIEQSADMMAVVDADHRYLLANPAFIERIGGGASVVGRAVPDVVGAELYRDTLRRELDRAFAGEVVQFEVHREYPGLGVRDLVVKYFPISATGEKAAVGAVIVDVTERKVAVEELAWENRVSAELAALARRLLSPGLEIRDVAFGVLESVRALTGSAHGFVSEIDPVTGDNVGHTLTEMLGDACRTQGTDRRVSFPRRPDGTYGHLWGLPLDTRAPVLTNEPAAHPSAGGLPDGHVPLVRFLSVPVTYGGQLVGQIALANAPSDYTKRHLGAVERLADLYAIAIGRLRAEGHRQRLEAELQRALRLESIGRLAGGIAHDFNNMLAVIGCNAAFALDQLGPGHAIVQDLEEIAAAARRSADLTRQLLAFARRQVTIPRALDLDGAVEGMLRMLRRLIGEGVNLEWQPAGGLRQVHVDPVQIDQILANLCLNARDAVGPHGTITIATARETVDEGAARATPGARPGRYVRLSVQDDGAGMTPEVLARIFEPFFTTKEFGQGTGLGLAMVHGAVHQAGGFITVDSAPGRGTTVAVHLPEHTGGGPGEQAGATRPEARGGPETILLVEDEGAVLRIASRALTGAGYRVLEASSTEQALALGAAHACDISLVVTDVVMPGMNGQDLARALSDAGVTSRVLFMSGYAPDLTDRTDVPGGRLHFIEKPFDPATLTASVREALDAPT